jgi:hypothetical protein
VRANLSAPIGSQLQHALQAPRQPNIFFNRATGAVLLGRRYDVCSDTGIARPAKRSRAARSRTPNMSSDLPSYFSHGLKGRDRTSSALNSQTSKETHFDSFHNDAEVATVSTSPCKRQGRRI